MDDFPFLRLVWEFFTRRIYWLFLAVGGVYMILGSAFSQEINAYKTVSSGNFPNIAIWAVWDGITWNPALIKPGQTNDIYIDQTHLLTLTGDEAVKSVFINADAGATQKLNLNNFNLDIYGSLQAFDGPAPGVPAGTNASTDWIGNSITSTITFKGVSRVIIPDGAWSAQSINSRYAVIFDPGPGVELITQKAFKALQFTIRSGIVNQKFNTTAMPNACASFSFNTNPSYFGTFGNFMIENGGTLISECNSDIMFRSVSISALNFDLQAGGTLILEGNAPRIEAANFQLNGKVIFRGGTSTKTFLSSSYTDAAVPNTVQDLELQGNQNLNLPNQLTLSGNLEKSGTGNFLTTNTSLNLAGSVDQEILGFPLVIRDLTLNKSGGTFYPNSNLTVQRNLTLNQGSMDLEGNDLSINTGLGGALSYSAGSWRNVGLLNYFGIPATLTASNATFPYEDTRNSGTRKVQLLGNSAGGNLSVSFTEYEGAEYNSAFNDNDIANTPILYRLFSYFTFSGLTPSASPLELRISADQLIVDNVDDLRIVSTGYAAPGAHLAGLDPVELWARRNLTFTDLVGTNFTVGSFRTLSILPVTWLEIGSKFTAEGVLINWKVTQQEDNLLYEVYRSSDPLRLEWKKIGVINAAGIPDEVQTYHFLDATPIKFEENYYRIKQVDLSGSNSWSEVTKVLKHHDQTLRNLIIYPNPYSFGALRLYFPRDFNLKNVELRIQNSQGKIIHQALYLESDLQLLVQSLAPGLYHLSIISEDQVLAGRLVKK